jgi:hypothetical protein
VKQIRRKHSSSLQHTTPTCSTETYSAEIRSGLPRKTVTALRTCILGGIQPRNDESFERNYLRGKYGAIPYLGDLSRIIIAAEQPQAEASENGA